MFVPLRTDRLLIRAAGPEDADALFVRRNDTETARYQSWEVPFPRERVESLLAATDELDGPTGDEWWMATVVEQETGQPVGDLVVQMSWDGRAAEIGYSLTRPYWGRGYATEAVEALVDDLVDRRGVRRLSATTHPDNVASIRVLERLGFEYEGRTAGPLLDGPGPQAVSGDDLRFALTRDRRQRWRNRPLDPPGHARPVDVDDSRGEGGSAGVSCPPAEGPGSLSG